MLLSALYIYFCKTVKNHGGKFQPKLARKGVLTCLQDFHLIKVILKYEGIFVEMMKGLEKGGD